MLPLRVSRSQDQKCCIQQMYTYFQTHQAVCVKYVQVFCISKKKKSVALCSTWYRLEFILNKELFANSAFSQNESDLASKNTMILEITTKISTHHKCLCGSDVGSWSLILCHHHYEDHASVCNQHSNVFDLSKMCLILKVPQKNENRKENERKKRNYEWACPASQGKLILPSAYLFTLRFMRQN